MEKILLLDNYDSFTYNLVHLIEKIICQDIDVYRNDQIAIDEIENYSKIILSPGPGIPNEAGILKELISTYYKTKKIFGVCLGMQAIVEVFGGKLLNLDTVFHGVATEMKIIESNEIIFSGLPEKFEAGRYHSWVANSNNFPNELLITSKDEFDNIMSVSHKTYDVKGVQFHPESILTPFGERILYNWLNS